jgi:hypothetical protein
MFSSNWFDNVAKNNFGCRDSLCKKIKIHTQSFADFELLTPTICLGNTPLINNKSNNANQFQWFLNTTLISKQTNPTNTRKRVRLLIFLGCEVRLRRVPGPEEDDRGQKNS